MKNKPRLPTATTTVSPRGGSLLLLCFSPEHCGTWADDGRWLTWETNPFRFFFSKLQKTTPRVGKPRVSRTKGHQSKRVAFVKDIVKEVAG